MSQRQMLCSQNKNASVHVLTQLSCFLAYVVEYRTRSSDEPGIKALIVRFSFQFKMLFCPREVQNFDHVSQGISGGPKAADFRHNKPYAVFLEICLDSVI